MSQERRGKPVLGLATLSKSQYLEQRQAALSRTQVEMALGHEQTLEIVLRDLGQIVRPDVYAARYKFHVHKYEDGLKNQDVNWPILELFGRVIKLGYDAHTKKSFDSIRTYGLDDAKDLHECIDEHKVQRGFKPVDRIGFVLFAAGLEIAAREAATSPETFLPR